MRLPDATGGKKEAGQTGGSCSAFRDKPSRRDWGYVELATGRGPIWYSLDKKEKQMVCQTPVCSAETGEVVAQAEQYTLSLNGRWTILAICKSKLATGVSPLCNPSDCSPHCLNHLQTSTKEKESREAGYRMIVIIKRSNRMVLETHLQRSKCL